MMVGEAPGQEEDQFGIPFHPGAQAGSVLERAIRRCGYNREQFVIVNVVPFRPPNNWLEGAPYEAEVIASCQPLLDAAIERYKPRALLALGSIATRALTGLAGPKLGVTNLVNFVLPSRYNIPAIPALHPSFLRRGKMSHFGTLLHGIKLAVTVAKEGRQAIVPDPDKPPVGYVLSPNGARALEFEQAAIGHKGFIAYDIETPYSGQEETAEEAEGEQAIKSIQFSLGQGTGIYFPWRDPYIGVAKRILALPNPKLSWNGWHFDDPILASNGAQINGERHDLMWAWHHLQPDLWDPGMGLQFVAAQLGWPWPWKHLDHASPQFYGIVDVDVLHWMAQ